MPKTRKDVTATITISRGEAEYDVEVTGTLQPPEYDVGIMGWWAEDIEACDCDGADVYLTEAEEDRAQEALIEVAGV